VLQRQNSEKVAERYVPLEATERDFQPIIEEIRQLKPDFIFSTIVGDSTACFYRAYADAGFDARSMPISSLTTSEAEVSQMGGAATGHFTSAPYFQSIDSEINRRCLERFRARFGNDGVPNLCWEAAYFQTHLLAKALAAAGSEEIGQLIPCLLGSEFDAPQGRVRIDPSNHHTCLYPRIGVVDSRGQFKIVRQATRAVHPDPYMVTHSLGDWAAELSSLEL
jgi:branched-chain amino acid transport system substrate-binding protein